MTTELTSEYEKQFDYLPTKWYEIEENRDWVFVLSTLAMALPYLLSLVTNLIERKLDDSIITTAFVSSLYFTVSLILDKYTTYRGFALLDFLETQGIQSPISELNPNLKHVTSAKEYLKKLVRIADLLSLSISVIPAIGVPLGAIRTLAALNNIRVVKRTWMAYKQKCETTNSN
jgi:hypothetical protein